MHKLMRELEEKQKQNFNIIINDLVYAIVVENGILT